MPKPFQVQRYEALLRKRLGLQGGLGLQLLEDVQAVIPMWGPGLPEDIFLRGENRWGQRITGGPTVGQFTGLTLHNPPGSGILAIVEDVANGSSQLIQAGFFAPSTLAGGTAQPMDTRQQDENPRPVCALNLESNAVQQVANPFAIVRSTGIGWTQPFILAPGTGLFVEGSTANTGFTAIPIWREVRIATTQELAQHG